MKHILTACLLALTNLAYAASSDPFGKASQKAIELHTILTGAVAIIFASIAIAIFGYGVIMGNMRKERAIQIVVGCFVIAGSSAISTFIFA